MVVRAGADDQSVVERHGDAVRYVGQCQGCGLERGDSVGGFDEFRFQCVLDVVEPGAGEFRVERDDVYGRAVERDDDDDVAGSADDDDHDDDDHDDGAADHDDDPAGHDDYDDHHDADVGFGR